jgi:hypothetical protein
LFKAVINSSGGADVVYLPSEAENGFSKPNDIAAEEHYRFSLGHLGLALLAASFVGALYGWHVRDRRPKHVVDLSLKASGLAAQVRHWAY